MKATLLPVQPAEFTRVLSSLPQSDRDIMSLWNTKGDIVLAADRLCHPGPGERRRGRSADVAVTS